MTALTLTLPRLGETMDEATVVGWLVEPGAAFRRGQPIVELETDKTVVEYPALGDGTLDEILAVSGARIPVGAPLARATVSDAGEWSDEAMAGPETPAAPAVGGAAGVATLLMPRLGETMEEGTVVRVAGEDIPISVSTALEAGSVPGPALIAETAARMLGARAAA